MLYHYTSLAGLIGIINSKCIWASHCEFLNDSNEFTHALNSAKSYSSDIFMDGDYISAFGWVVIDSLDKMQKHDVFVTSFSEKPDLLSQWRGYCPQGAGVCIGFDKEKIRKFCEKHGYKFEKCIYDGCVQKSQIYKYLNECLGKFPKPKLSEADYDALDTKDQVDHEIGYRALIESEAHKEAADIALSDFVGKINEIAPLMKDTGFHEEAEWRIISRNPPVKNEFRHSKSHITPYIKLPILEEFRDSIKEIIIGPNPEKLRCENSVERLLRVSGFADVELKLSTIPFSSW